MESEVSLSRSQGPEAEEKREREKKDLISLV
jgi:hypothetical protein